MWNWLNCYLSGRHDYGVTCSSGSIYLRCIHCGKRSEGWAVHGQRHPHAMVAAPARLVNQTQTTGNVKCALPLIRPRVASHRRSA